MDGSSVLAVLDRIPYIARLIAVAALVTLGLAAIAEWIHTGEPLASLPAIFAAILVMLASYLLPAAAGIAFGIWVAGKSKSNALGWVVGIVIWCALAWPADHFATKVPGIGWRVAAMQEEGE
jgi:hypothetical protein